MKQLFVIFALVCIAELSYSQTDFRKGYVVVNTTDTLFGWVDYREGAKVYKSCDFKNSENGNAVTYQPDEITGYGFENDKAFQSKEISIKDQPTQIVFLEVLVKGRVSLYKFGGNYFVDKNNQELRQLTNEEEEVVVDGRRVARNSNQYIGVVTTYVFDCNEIREKVQSAKLNERSLTNLIEYYNKCIGEPGVTFKAKRPWTKITVGVVGGLNVSQLSFSSTQAYTHLAEKFEASYSPVVGASFDILSPRVSERFSLSADILYLNSKYQNSTITDRNYSIVRDDVTIELSNLKIPIGIRYTFPQRKITPYINIGISNTISLSSDSKWIQEIESTSNDVVIVNEDEALEIKNRPFGLWGGFGVVKSVSNKLNASIEVRYEQTDGIAPYSITSQGLSSKITNFQILIAIRTK